MLRQIIISTILFFTVNSGAYNSSGKKFELKKDEIPQGILGCAECFNFTAPIVNDAETIEAPEVGLIVYDANDSRFKGQTHSGNWQVLGGSGAYALKSKQVFTSSGTWTKPEGVVAVVVEVQGAGGAGGSCDGTGTGVAAAGGGGSGAYASKFITTTLASTETIVVGIGGVVNSGGAGSNGGTSSFGSVIASGGIGGSGVTGKTTSDTVGATGGSGGSTVSGGDLNIIGNSGGFGLNFGIASTALSGKGANSRYGQGGKSVTAPNAGNTGGRGAGGSGGATTGTARDGGAGGDGLVIVWEYVSN